MEKNESKLLWGHAAFLTITPLLCLIFLPLYFMNHEATWGMLIFFAICYAISGLSITMGYHRLFAHRSFDAHPIVRFLLLFFGAGAFQGPVLKWATDHRRHHQKVDSEDDPYTISKGFWWAHMGWVLFEDESKYRDRFAPDLQADFLMRSQNRYYLAWAGLSGFVLPGVIGWAAGWGWGGLLLGGLLRTVLSQHATFLINSYCHRFGRQPYGQDHSARDSWLMAFVTFGEGFHNFHHEFQADYRNGVRWYQWDPTKWTIASLSWLGLARRLRRISEFEILKARMRNDLSWAESRGIAADRLRALHEQIERAQEKIQRLKLEYQKLAHEMRENSHQHYLQLRAELRMAQIEFRAARQQWHIYFESLRLCHA